MATCTNGHASSASDYCDVCGDPIAIVAVPLAAGAGQGLFKPGVPPQSGSPIGPHIACPSCTAENMGGALFCEDCGYDFTTGQLPPALAASSLSIEPSSHGGQPTVIGAVSAPASGTGWVGEVWVDPDWFELHGKELGDPCPSATTPKVVVLYDSTVTIGRGSRGRGISPTIDCGTDSAVSHVHAALTLDGDRWFLEDLDSTNGTYISMAGSPMPQAPIEASTKRELAVNERIQLGAWTRIVVRGALPGE